MKLDLIVNTAMTEFKTKLTELCSELPDDCLTPGSRGGGFGACAHGAERGRHPRDGSLACIPG
jgi:hypothetical protein